MRFAHAGAPRSLELVRAKVGPGRLALHAPGETGPPSAPESLSASRDGDTGASLSWTRTGSYDEQHLYQWTAATGWTLEDDTLSGSAESASLSGLSAGTVHRWVVVAVRGEEESDPSNTAELQTSDAVEIAVRDVGDVAVLLYPQRIDSTFQDTSGTPADVGDRVRRVLNILENGTASTIRRAEAPSDADRPTLRTESSIRYLELDGDWLEQLTAALRNTELAPHSDDDWCALAVVRAADVVANQTVWDNRPDGGSASDEGTRLTVEEDSGDHEIDVSSRGTGVGMAGYAPAVWQLVAVRWDGSDMHMRIGGSQETHGFVSANNSVAPGPLRWGVRAGGIHILQGDLALAVVFDADPATVDLEAAETEIMDHFGITPLSSGGGGGGGGSTPPPDAPTLTLTSLDDTSLDVEASDEGATGYIFYASDSPGEPVGPWNEVQDSASRTLSLSGLDPDTAQYIQCVAYDSNGESDPSDELSATTWPDAPKEFTATRTSSGSANPIDIDIAWTEGTRDAGALELEWSDNGGSSWNALDTPALGSSPYSWTDVESDGVTAGDDIEIRGRFTGPASDYASDTVLAENPD